MAGVEEASVAGAEGAVVEDSAAGVAEGSHPVAVPAAAAAALVSAGLQAWDYAASKTTGCPLNPNWRCIIFPS